MDRLSTGRCELIDRPRHAPSGCFDLSNDQPLTLQFFQDVIDRREADLCPLAHPALFDDLLNLVPARLTALLLLLAGAFSGRSVARAYRIWRRDARNTSSPNAGHPMAMMAGLLRVRLDKRDVYSLGDPELPLDAESIVAAWRLVRLAAFFAAAFALVLVVIT